MSELNGEGRVQDPIERMKADISGVLGINDQIKCLVSERDAFMDSIKKNIVENHIPEELKYLVISLLNNRHGSEDKVVQDAEKLRLLDEQLSEHAGQMVAWLDVDTKVVAYRDPGPNTTETAHYFNVGLLPMDAHLDIFINSWPKIIVEKAVRMKFSDFETDEITWERVAKVNLQAFVGAPESQVRPEIYAGPNGARGFAEGKIVMLPMPLIGDEEVKALINDHHLETQPQVKQGLDLLVGTTLF
jgi:hypothetical protein